jgi:CRISPR-associated protein Csc3
MTDDNTTRGEFGTGESAEDDEQAAQTNERADSTDDQPNADPLANIEGMLGHYPGNEDGDTDDRDDDESDRTVEERVVSAFKRDVAPKLVNAGWGFEAAKSVEFGKTDQSLVNHVRNGVSALARVNEVIDVVGGVPRDEAALRDAVALFVIHDIHKLDKERDADGEERFDIPVAEVEEYVDQFGLLEWADSLKIKDFHSCAVDHHDDWAANHATSTVRFNDYRPLIRLADAFASCDAPERAVRRNLVDSITAAYPNASGSVDLRYHRLDDVKGVLTNLVNAAVAETLGESYQRLLIYQDGCVYLTDAETPKPELDEQFVDDVFTTLKTNVRDAHPAYKDYGQLVGNLSVLHAQNAYKINDQDFFYAGPKRVLRAVCLKANGDMDPETDPTDAMERSMSELEAYLPFDIERTREPVGLARLVYTVKRSFVDPVLDATDADTSGIAATCAVFGVEEAVESGLETAAEELSLTAGGKWDYAYGVAQSLLNEGLTDHTELTDRIVAGLDDLDEEWREIVETARAGSLRTELEAYLCDVIALDGEMVTAEASESLTDPFAEYSGSRRGKTCVLCNRGTTGTKGDMKAPKSLTTLQAGYSNHIAVDSGKPDELLACYPCQIELSLRETGSGRREGGRLWMHFVPDYFYTPLSWRDYSDFVGNFNTEARTEFGGLAESVLHIGGGGVSPSTRRGEDDATVLGSYVEALIDDEYGRSMIETLDQGYDPGVEYGALTLGYFKPKDNDTEFQFFGVFLALALAAYTGLRVVVSGSPIPDVRGRDFQTYARVGAGFTQVQDFYGTEIPLSALRSRVDAAAALIRLGYASGKEDALFAKYLRATRNKLLPGSYLLKRLAQSDDGSDARYLLEEARVLDEESGGVVSE